MHLCAGGRFTGSSDICKVEREILSEYHIKSARFSVIQQQQCVVHVVRKGKGVLLCFLKKWQHTGIFFYRILYGGVAAAVWQLPTLCCQNQLLLLLNQASVATTALFFAVWICICVCGVWQKCSWQLWAAAAAVWTWIEFVQSDFFLFFFFTKWEFGGTRSHYQQHICGSI